MTGGKAMNRFSVPGPVSWGGTVISGVGAAASSRSPALSKILAAGGSTVSDEKRLEVTFESFNRSYLNPSGYASVKDVVNTIGAAVHARCDRLQIERMVRWSMEKSGLLAAEAFGDKAKGTLGRDAVIFVLEQYMVSLGLAMCSWPIYWVGRELLAAALMSDPPEDVTFEGMHWPRNAMLFMLPDRVFGFGNGYYRWVAVARYDRDAEAVDAVLAKMVKSFAVAPMFDGSVSFLAGHSSGMVHTVTHAASGSLADVKKMHLEEEVVEGDTFDLLGVDVDGARGMSQTLTMLTMNLVLIMQARRELLTGGGIAKKIKGKRGEGKKTLWSPLFIGRDYRVEREEASKVGTHASPRMHWRRGHWRMNVCGPRLTAEKQRISPDKRQHVLKWIEPMLVNAKQKETT